MLRGLRTNSEYNEIPSLSIKKRNEEEIISYPLTCLVRCHGPDPNSERAKYHLLNYTKYPLYTNIYVIYLSVLIMILLLDIYLI